MKKKKIYISGPISGQPRWYYLRQFAEEEHRLKKQGYDVVNPTKLPPCRWPWLYRLLGYRLTLLYDLYKLSRCTHIYMLPGWQQSKGARLEHMKAHQWRLTVES